MADSVNPDEMAHDEPSHLDLHCLLKNLSRFAGSKFLMVKQLGPNILFSKIQ